MKIATETKPLLLNSEEDALDEEQLDGLEEDVESLSSGDDEEEDYQ